MNALLTLVKSTTLAGKGLLLSLSALLAVLISMKTILLGLCILILIDLITGIRANLHDWGISCNPFKKVFWKSIKSYLLRKTWKKTYEYGIGILVVAIFETMFFGAPMSIILMEKVFTLSELAALIPALVEVWSIFENFEAVSNKNILKRLVFLLPSRMRSVLTGEEHKEDPYNEID
tara:strand:- start:89 stop:619 length:531 start_codon:yes stop_codon:yes gene_type:complete